MTQLELAQVFEDAVAKIVWRADNDRISVDLPANAGMLAINVINGDFFTNEGRIERRAQHIALFLTILAEMAERGDLTLQGLR